MAKKNNTFYSSQQTCNADSMLILQPAKGTEGDVAPQLVDVKGDVKAMVVAFAA